MEDPFVTYDGWTSGEMQVQPVNQQSNRIGGREEEDGKGKKDVDDVQTEDELHVNVMWRESNGRGNERDNTFATHAWMKDTAHILHKREEEDDERMESECHVGD